MSSDAKPVIYLGSNKKDLQKLPRAVQEVFAHGIQMAAEGDTHPDAKALKGYGGRSVIEIIEDHKSDTYRAVYTVRFKTAVYVLHVFKKKSTKGIATPKKDKELIDSRLKYAASHYKNWEKEQAKKQGGR